MPILQSEEYSGAGVCSYSPESPVGHIATRSDVASTGVGRKGDEPMRDCLGELVKSLAFSASMAADLALIEDQ